MRGTRFPALAALPLAALLLSGCVSPEPVRAPASQAPAPDAPKRGGTLNVRIAVDPFDWDMSTSGKTDPNEVGIAYAYNSLLAFKKGEGIGYADTIIMPDLAETWEVSQDARTFTFHLRKGVKFAPQAPVNGRELTSADVKWSYEYLSRTGQFKDKKYGASQVSYMFEGMTGIDTPDPYTVVVRFENPFAPFLNYAGSDWNPIMAHEIADRDGNLKDALAGTGPYLLDGASSQKGTRWVWKRNPNYREPETQHLDEIRWLLLADDSAAAAAFQTKQIDVFDTGLAYQDFTDLAQKNPQMQSYQFLIPRGSHAYISQARPGPFNDIRVRRALSYALDRDEVLRVKSGGQGAWALPAAIPGLFTDAETKELVRYDVQEARRLLAEAGYPGGIAVEWPVSRDDSTATRTFFELLQAQFKKAGIDAQFKVYDKATQRQKRYAGDYDIDFAVGALGGVDVDPDFQIYGVYYSGSSANWPRINDPELDKLVIAQRQEADPAKRREIMRAVTRLIVEKAWAVEAVYSPTWYPSQPYVRNYRPHIGDRSDGHTQVWLDK